MSSAAISKYYDASGNRMIRDDLLFAVGNVGEPKVAIDCGCGAGADIAYLVGTHLRMPEPSLRESHIGGTYFRWSERSLRD